jgi:uncharacterized protein
VRRCVLLFARTPDEDARKKRLPSGRPVFASIASRIRRSVSTLPGVDLVRAAGQRGSTFAERLAHAFRAARARGYQAIVAVPQDVPGIDTRVLRAAFEALDAREVVLGPATDGGVYLIGATIAIETSFDQVRWRTSSVLSDLVGLHQGVRLLEPLDEIDTRQDLIRFLRSGERGVASMIARAAPRPFEGDAFIPRSAPIARALRIRGPPMAAA